MKNIRKIFENLNKCPLTDNTPRILSEQTTAREMRAAIGLEPPRGYKTRRNAPTIHKTLGPKNRNKPRKMYTHNTRKVCFKTSHRLQVVAPDGPLSISLFSSPQLFHPFHFFTFLHSPLLHPTFFFISFGHAEEGLVYRLAGP